MEFSYNNFKNGIIFEKKVTILFRMFHKDILCSNEVDKILQLLISQKMSQRHSSVKFDLPYKTLTLDQQF